MKLEKNVIYFTGYIEINELVCNFLKELDDLQNFQNNFIIINLKNKCVCLLENFSKGYSRFYKKDKCFFYSKSKDNLSEIISNLLLLYKFDIFTKEQFDRFFYLFNLKFSIFNGLLKKFEKNE